MSDFLVRGSLGELDPELAELADLEAERQFRKLILIPSESTAPLAVLEALGTAFHNIYAEGYPDESWRWMQEDDLLDLEARLAEYRRYSDLRYYKGVEYVDVVESLARRRAAEAFAANGYSADDIYVNVQPLSGAPANNAVYHALVEPGDTVMGMNLIHGGHLTHGSPVNRSGKVYNAVHYNVDPETEQIDYEQVAQVAEQHRPKVIIAGYSSYPWTVDWERFREIADAVGAYLLADIAHVAGLVAAGVYPSPIGHAHVVSFTTHKSLCGPRGAAILTLDRKLARLIDRAVFPGEQGGPHINTILAQALTFKLAQTDSFRDLQAQIVANCVAMTDAIAEQGLRIPYGGTNTHLSNIDCASVVGQDGTPLSGDMAARILDVAGIVCNRNTIPGDRSALNPSGIRIGTPWITQRGFDEQDCRAVGELIALVLNACQPYAYPGRTKQAQRAKIDFVTIEQVKLEVRDLAVSKGIDYEPQSHGYPHYYFLDDPTPDDDFIVIEIAGRDADEVIRWTTSGLPEKSDEGQPFGLSLYGNGNSTDAVATRKAGDLWELVVPAEHAGWALTWLRSVSDAYVCIDPDDLHRKVPGPVAVRLAGGQAELPDVARFAEGTRKPWHVGIEMGRGAEPLPVFEWQEPAEQDLRRTALYDSHVAAGARMVPFAGWEMPVRYSSVLDEHRAVREAAGLFDVSHMGVFSAEGRGAAAFLDSVVGNDISGLKVGQSVYAHCLDPDGQVIDDLMVYRLPDFYMLVVNASNNDKDWAWLTAVNAGQVRVDSDRPWAVVPGAGARLRDLRDPDSGADMRVDLALQGPKARQILLDLGTSDETAAQLRGLPWAGVLQGEFGGYDLIVSRTGYTGERVAFELFVRPDRSVDLWNDLIAAGQPYRIKPAGLGARDSLRTEAGLPLYGHEMAGDMQLTVGQAGFGNYVKTYKPWFIGRSAFLEQEARRDTDVVRFRFNEKNVRMAHYGDPVVDGNGRVVGKVTSCAVDQEGFLLGQALIKSELARHGTPIAIFQGGAPADGGGEQVGIGARLTVPTAATVLRRFPG